MFGNPRQENSTVGKDSLTKYIVGGENIRLLRCSRKQPSASNVTPRAALAPPPHATTSLLRRSYTGSAQPCSTQSDSIEPLPYPTQPNPGEVTLEDFIAFAEKKTWGQEESTDPFNTLLAATANEAVLSSATAGGAERGGAGATLGDECSDSDAEEARCGS